MITALELARAARAKIACEVNWTKGYSWTDAFGNRVDDENEACRFCAYGAVTAVRLSDKSLDYPLTFKQAYKVEDLLDRLVGVEYNEDFISFNDAPTTTHAMVLDLFDRAIARLGAEP